MTIKLSEVAKEKAIAYFLISFVDMNGSLRAKLVPATAIDKMQSDGAGFAGFAASMDMTPAHPDMLAKPDPETLIQLPWKPEVGWLASDCWMDGEPVASSPRVLLKRLIGKARDEGYRMKSGVECEFFLIDATEMKPADRYDSTRKPCYDQLTLMRQFDVVKRISDAMQQLGWGPYQTDHEDGNGQFEMNWGFDDALVTADRHVFFKYMVKTIAEEFGMRATFMPKPFDNLTGSGCHAHVSLWDVPGQDNLFLDGGNDPLGMSMLAYNFLGGVMGEAEALASIFNPTINSYKRIDATTTLSGATWSPNAITYSGDNRTHMIRIPEAGRFEMRLMDGAANPYLMQAGTLGTGLDGIEHARDPGKPAYNNMYEDGQRLKRVRRLPLNLLDATRLTSRSKVLRRQLGDEFIDSHVKLRFDEWRRYATTLSQWEIENTFDC